MNPDGNVQEIEFSRASLQQTYLSGEARLVNPERWRRVREELSFPDVVDLVLDKRGSPISCPFHGRDSRPSFYIYARTNDAYCFGCARVYDAVYLVARHMTVSRLTALRWLEKKFELPPIHDLSVEPEEEETEEVEVQVEFGDLARLYVRQAQREIQRLQDPMVAEEYLRIYFDAERESSALPLARILGRETVQRIAEQKAHA